jgi:4-oxalocrotonate tautomerase
MPLVRIDVLQGYSDAERKSIGDCVQRAMVETLDVPERDRFHLISAHGAGDFDFNRSYLDIDRTDRFVLVQVTLSAGRSTEAKQAFYARLAELLEAAIGLPGRKRTPQLVVRPRRSKLRGAPSRAVAPSYTDALTGPSNWQMGAASAWPIKDGPPLPLAA